MALALIFFLLPWTLGGQEVPIPDSPTRWVTDTAGFIPPATATDLDRRLEAYEQQTGHQLLVYIATTTGVVPIEDWAVRAFARWQVGRKGIDDGLVLFIMSEDQRLRFEVGYGLEDEVPDAIAVRIINETLVPGIRGGDVGSAVTAAMEEIAEAIGTPLPAGALPSPVQRGRQPEPLGVGQLIFFAIIGLVFLIILGTNPTIAIWLLAQMLAGGGGRHHGGGWGGGGRGWGGGGGGGGFRGGGGRSGGGGASGSW